MVRATRQVKKKTRKKKGKNKKGRKEEERRGECGGGERRRELHISSHTYDSSKTDALLHELL
jgi:hypothetical protein